VQPTFTIRVRTSRRESAGGDARFLLVASSGDQSLVLSLSVPSSGDPVEIGVCVSEQGAIDVPDRALFDALPRRPASHRDLDALGLLDGHARPLVFSVLRLPMANHFAGIVRRVAHPADPDLSPFGFMAETALSELPRPTAPVLDLESLDDEPDPGWIECEVPRRQVAMLAMEIGEHCSGDPGLDRRFDAFDAFGPVRRAISTWAMAVAKSLEPNGIALGSTGWTPRAHRHYASPGPQSLRRAQSARLHPAFSPLLAHDEALVGAVDAGIPHEAILDASVRRMIRAPGERPFGPARMRRLRRLPRTFRPGILWTSLRLASGIRPDLLPETEDGWTVFAAVAPGIVPAALDLGLDPDALLSTRATPWREPLSGDDAARASAAIERARTHHGQTSLPDGLSILAEGIDMAARLASTLVEPLLPVNPVSGSRAGHLTQRSLSLSGRLLFWGKTLDRVLGLANAWHDGLDTFERALPRPGDDVTWPALFADVRADDGLVLTCLVRPSELMAEGAGGRDAFGDGLSHCVGGYVPDCASRRSHIVSIRREIPDGSLVRLSTAELSVDPGDDGISVVQHKGARNAPPPYEAEAALRHLLDAIRSGLVATDPDAMREIELIAGYDGIDWSDSASTHASFAAWSPYLPRRVAKGGVDGLVRTLSAMEAAGVGGAP
jgi:hypothetical protein